MMGRALIVDDSLTIRMDLVAGLEAAGIATCACATLSDARAALAREAFPLILLDVMLPDGDGVALLADIRIGPSAHAHVVLFSTEAEVRDRIRGLSSGADEYVAKPYDRDDLVRRAARHCLAPPAAEGARPSVLVVDDSATFRDVLATALRDAGYEVLEAPDGETGLRLAASALPQAMIVDRVLPGIDGPTVIRRMRLDPALRTMPCVLLTGSARETDELDALDAGADGFAHKEADLGVVLARLAAVLRNARETGRRSAEAALRRRVLVVDAEPGERASLAAWLASEGHEAVLASSGHDALALLALQRVDCILLDAGLRDVDGLEVCARIKASPLLRDTPLVARVDRDDRDAALACLVAGADDVLAKAADTAVLAARVRAQLRRRAYEAEARAAREELLARQREAAQAAAARELAETRARMAAELARKNEELEAFSYSVSHDLRAPLRGIDGFAQILAEDYGPVLDDTGRAHLARIRGATQRMAHLIDDLLTLARMTQADLRPTSVDVSVLARTVLAELASRAPERSVTIEIAPELVVRADPGLMRVVLENLLGNAWKFTQRKPHAHVEVGRAPSGFFVRDDGAGFDMAQVPQLFRAFRRLHSQREFEGTGIGLATVHRIVERHGGTITVDAAPGRGATFTITLPG